MSETIKMTGALYYNQYLSYWTDGKITRRAYNIDKDTNTCEIIIKNKKIVVGWHWGADNAEAYN